MKGTFITMCIVFTAALGICIISMRAQFRVLDKLDAGCGDAIAAVVNDDIMTAMEHVQRLNDVLESNMWFMEFVSSHDQLHEAVSGIIEAQVALECSDMDDAYQALAGLEGTLEHLREHETLSMSNIC